MHLPALVLCFAPWLTPPVPAAQVLQPEFLDATGVAGNGLLVSGDGSTAVAILLGQGPELLRWRALAAPEAIPLGSGLISVAAVSENGDFIAGQRTPAVAVVWDGAGQETVLGDLYGGLTTPVAMDAAGQTVVGRSLTSNGVPRSFRWTASGGIQNLGTLNGPGGSEAFAVSDDGAVVVGQGYEAGVGRAFRWTEAAGMVALPVPSPSTALDVSADGQTVLGKYRPVGAPSNVRQPFLWTASGGAIDIGPEARNRIGYFRLSADGAAAAWELGDDATVFHWSAATGGTRSLPLHSLIDLSRDGSALVVRPITLSVYRLMTETGEFFDLGSPLGTFAEGVAISDDGRSVIGSVAMLAGSNGFQPALWRRGSEIGARVCAPGIRNSTGAAADLWATGTNLIAAQDLTLTADSLPPATFGFFLASRESRTVFPVPQSQGRLCLGGAIGRFVAPGQVKQSSANGDFSLALPLTAIATPSGPVAIAPGETWYFQAWFRDLNPGPTSNFTSAVGLTVR